ncbi:MAG: helix-turn-helix domain-containing protein [Magnetococcales bacterium]|nr:helix-turn-helix domain-containing protein [Magnetococcales bacterium]
MQMRTRIQIGKLAKAGGCKVQTIRYYEEIGLLEPPMRSSGNQRIYAQHHLDRLVFIRHCRDLGFPLDRIRKLLALNDDSERACEEVEEIAREQLGEVERKISILNGLKLELERIINSCSGLGPAGDCEIIQALADHSACFSNHHEGDEKG